MSMIANDSTRSGLSHVDSNRNMTLTSFHGGAKTRSSKNTGKCSSKNNAQSFGYQLTVSVQSYKIEAITDWDRKIAENAGVISDLRLAFTINISFINVDIQMIADTPTSGE